MHTAEYKHFAAALCEPGAGLPAGLSAPTGCAIEERFAIHRNNVHVGLVDCLAEAFPLVRAQVGEEFFTALARAYVQRHKPESPLLTYYGESFPAFINGFEPAASLPWLPDLARLERAWSESWSAAEAPSLTLSLLARLDAEALARSRITPHPAARLVRSEWPVASLWEGHHSGRTDFSQLDWEPQDVLITRPGADVLLQRLAAGEARFIALLLDGAAIETAAAAASPADPGATLGRLLEAGLIQELQT